MENSDIKAHVDALETLVTTLSDSLPSGRLTAYFTIKIILDELKVQATERRASGNIRCVLTEIDSEAKALAGLYPSYRRREEDHRSLALNSISKLSMPTCFDLR